MHVGAKRRLGCPEQSKQPLTLDLITTFCEKYNGNSTLADVRFQFVLLVCYAGSLRVDEIQQLRIQDIAISEGHAKESSPSESQNEKMSSTAKAIHHCWLDPLRSRVPLV